MGYKTYSSESTFSQCSINQIYEEFKNKNLECLFTRHGECPDFKDFTGVCGDGVKNGFEECDTGPVNDPADCCDDSCRLIPGCCPSGETYECIVVETEGNRQGAYGGCVTPSQAIVHQQRVNRFGMIPSQPFFLKQTKYIISAVLDRTLELEVHLHSGLFRRTRCRGMKEALKVIFILLSQTVPLRKKDRFLIWDPDFQTLAFGKSLDASITR